MRRISDTHRAIVRSARATLEVLATLLIIVVSVVVLTRLVRTSSGGPLAELPRSTGRAAPPSVPREPVTIKGAALLGQPSAPVTMLIFSDFQCPFCARFARESLPTIVAKYVNTGRVLVAFRPFPLEGIHSFAFRAAEAAECASRVGKFWPMHDVIFANQAALSESGLETWSASVGLNPGGFRNCMNDRGVGEAIRASEDAGNAVGVVGTPTFFIGGRVSHQTINVKTRLSGALPPEAFARAIEAVLSTLAQQ